jgi:hypothetical protein
VTKTKTKDDKMRYVTVIPRKPLPKGRVLVHNHVVPQKTIGMNGFRAWTQKRTKDLVLCPCDWAGVDLRNLRHYHVRGFGSQRSSRFNESNGRCAVLRV